MQIREIIEARAREEAERVIRSIDEAIELDNPWYGYPAARRVVWVQYPGERKHWSQP